MAIIKRITVQSKILQYKTNCYLIGDKKKDIIIIDPGAQHRKIIRKIKRIHGNPIKILLTHGHPDHWMAIYGLKQKWKDIPILIHEADSEYFEKSYQKFKSMLLGVSLMQGNNKKIKRLKRILNELELMRKIRPDDFLIESNVVEVNGIELGILHTPGHSDGSVCLYTIHEHVFENTKYKHVIFTGDLVFVNGIGINEMVIAFGGNRLKLWKSIKHKIISNKKIPKDILIYPGHNRSMLTKCAKQWLFIDLIQHPETLHIGA
jgi:glyoxylase-like metal-dependent hydrolase (beta-lactamase superfamily II)